MNNPAIGTAYASLVMSVVIGAVGLVTWKVGVIAIAAALALLGLAGIGFLR